MWRKGFPRPTATMAEVKGQEDEEDIGRNILSTSSWPLKRNQKEEDHIWCALRKEASLWLSGLGDREWLECKEDGESENEMSARKENWLMVNCMREWKIKGVVNLFISVCVERCWGVILCENIWMYQQQQRCQDKEWTVNERLKKCLNEKTMFVFFILFDSKHLIYIDICILYVLWVFFACFPFISAFTLRHCCWLLLIIIA